jgi:hypothetical protein
MGLEMNSENLLVFLQSDSYRHQAAGLYFASLAGATAILVVVLVLYVRAKHSRARKMENIPLLLATAFDSFLVSLLYIAMDFLYRADSFQLDAADVETTAIVIGPLLTSYGRFLIGLVLAVIALRRAERLARWFFKENQD